MSQVQPEQHWVVLLDMIIYIYIYTHIVPSLGKEGCLYMGVASETEGCLYTGVAHPKKGTMCRYDIYIYIYVCMTYIYRERKRER